jgi:Excreted virulence factor EspC, type VII ESX diderm
MVDDAHVHAPDPNVREPPGALDRRIAMLVDTDAIHALGAHCSNQADDLSQAVDAMKALPGPDTAAAFGPVGARFLDTLAEAIAAEARAVAILAEELASARSRTGAVAGAYTDADRRGSRLL